MDEDKGAYLQDRGNSSLLRGFRNCRSYHRARFGNGISRLVHSRTYYVPDRICEIESNIDEEIIERTDYINEDTLLHDEETEEISEEVKVLDLSSLSGKITILINPLSSPALSN